MLEITECGGILHLKVRVQPRASVECIAGERGGALTLKVTAVPEKGKANRAAVELLSKKLGIARSAVSIVRGEHSRYKLFAIKGIAKEAVLKVMLE
jgi:uncharacterized protein (TIGR00251 family)